MCLKGQGEVCVALDLCHAILYQGLTPIERDRPCRAFG